MCVGLSTIHIESIDIYIDTTNSSSSIESLYMKNLDWLARTARIFGSPAPFTESSHTESSTTVPTDVGPTSDVLINVVSSRKCSLLNIFASSILYCLLMSHYSYLLPRMS